MVYNTTITKKTPKMKTKRSGNKFIVTATKEKIIRVIKGTEFKLENHKGLL